jgi:wyosine [tRNA(Phe)-imidazoG37] synthetase (radical SAM superfamily)
MTDRLAKPDTDFFENHRYQTNANLDVLRHTCSALVRKRISMNADPQEREDLAAVLGYLGNAAEHDSEGRDLGVDKQSFSRTELHTCMRLPISQQVEYLLYRYRFNVYPRQRRLRRVPIILAVEPTSVCNIRCTMCFQMDSALSRDRSLRGFMDPGLYKRIIDEAALKGVCGIVLASRGEPLLHKHITDFVEIAKQAGIIDVKLNTNATRLTESVSRQLLRAGLDTLVFSVDSAVKEQFEKIRMGAKFDQIVENVSRFHEIRRSEFPESRTRTRISMVLQDHDQNAKYAAAFWRSLVDEFAVRWAIPRLGIYDQALNSNSRPCSLLWERLYVWWDGVVNTCDEDYLSWLKIGQLTAVGGPSIEQLWTGDRMNHYRQLHIRNAKSELSPCANCPGF